MNNLKISTRLAILTGMLCTLAGRHRRARPVGHQQSNDSLKSVYEDRTVPLAQLGDIQHHQLLSQIAIDLALIDPSPAHLAEVGGEVENNSATISKEWTAYMATFLTARREGTRAALHRGRVHATASRPCDRRWPPCARVIWPRPSAWKPPPSAPCTPKSTSTSKR